jgi:HSP20 family protein
MRWDPYRELATVQDRLSRLVSDAYGRALPDDDVMARGAWMPAVDIFQNKQEIVLKAELPGLDRENIDLRVENKTLTLRGERKQQNEIKEEQYHRIERSYGSFSRSFTLPETIDTEKLRAEYKDGVLTVTMPIKEEAKPKQIQVQVN